MLSDEERQEDEIFALQNICDTSEFRYKKETNIECLFSISCCLVNDKLLIKNDTNFKSTSKNLYINHLPHARLYVQLPKNYPSSSAPHYYLAINWLPPWQVSLTCQKLDELWSENEFYEILFIWIDFLKNELLNYLNLKDSLDVTYFYDLFENPMDEYLLEVLRWTDDRVVYGGLYLNPIERLEDYNEFKNLLEFETNIQECGICFLTYYGKMCVKVELCNHVFCKDCIKQFLKTKIDERNVENIKCPAFDCKINLNHSQIAEICSTDLYEKYKECLTEIRLLNRRNLVYCPRKICHAAVIVKDGESLASCLECEYNFCAYCFKVYHGVMACDMNSEEKLKLIEEYENGDKITKKMLEKKYGKNQIRQVIEKELTSKYLKENTRACPTCKTVTAKISGCNLMNCLHCYTFFCWICNSKIISGDPYDHFKSVRNGPCQGLLFEGVNEEEENNLALNDHNIIENFEINDEVEEIEVDIYDFNELENIELLIFDDFE